MAAFAANGLLCRMALGGGAIDATSFTTVRFVSGALALLLFGARPGLRATSRAGGWTSAAVLFAYAFPFAFAYAQLPTGTGALVLFGAVQVTMIVAGLIAGERPSAFEWCGLVGAIAGLVWLVMPGLSSSPPLGGAALMMAAGAAWGLYSLLARASTRPLDDVAGTFLRLAPATLAMSVILAAQRNSTARGLVLAVASGVIATAGGYVVWNIALRSLTATRAAILQLSVPVLAAFGGAVILQEAVTGRLITAAVLILGGIGLAIAGRTRGVQRGPRSHAAN